MKTILRLAFLLVALAGVAASGRAASVQGILITASNQPGEIDRRLAPYEPTLRRILRFESYHYVGEDRTSIEVPASGTLSVGDGHQLEITTEKSDGKSVHVKVRWLSGGRTLMNTGLALRAGVPAVLGGPAKANGEVYAVILIGR
jgi:hypothetical protein